MKKYNKYKDSGIEWIGEIPENWGIYRLRNISESIKTGSTPPSEEIQYFEPQELNWFGPGDFDNLILNNAKRKISNLAIEENKCRLFPSNSILLIGIGATVGKVGIVSEASTSNQQINVIILKNEYNPKYYTYFISTIKDIIVMEASSATLPIFNQTQTKNIVLPVPPFQEQTTIANYLDQKTTQIDSLIAKKEQFITLLQEERTAVINQAVTKGLDPKVQMKDSGIEWLGEIPEHWEVKRMKYVVKTPLKYGANESAEDEILEDPRYIRITDFGNDGKLRKNTFKSLSLDKAENFLLEEGDILFARSGATVGKTFFFKDYEGVACFAGYLIKASCDPMIMKSEFLYEFTNSSGYENWKQSIFQQSTIQNIGADKYNQLKVGVPPIQEQQKIIDFITSKTNEINNLISKSEQEIELLKEYKTALISEVVTGKVDVREEILN